MQVCTSLLTDNHASTPPLSFLQAGCPSCRPTNSVKAVKASFCMGKGAVKSAGPGVWHTVLTYWLFYGWSVLLVESTNPLPSSESLDPSLNNTTAWQKWGVTLRRNSTTCVSSAETGPWQEWKWKLPDRNSVGESGVTTTGMGWKWDRQERDGNGKRHTGPMQKSTTDSHYTDLNSFTQHWWRMKSTNAAETDYNNSNKCPR